MEAADYCRGYPGMMFKVRNEIFFSELLDSEEELAKLTSKDREDYNLWYLNYDCNYLEHWHPVHNGLPGRWYVAVGRTCRSCEKELPEHIYNQMLLRTLE